MACAWSIICLPVLTLFSEKLQFMGHFPLSLLWRRVWPVYQKTTLLEIDHHHVTLDRIGLGYSFFAHIFHSLSKDDMSVTGLPWQTISSCIQRPRLCNTITDTFPLFSLISTAARLFSHSNLWQSEINVFFFSFLEGYSWTPSFIFLNFSTKGSLLTPCCQRYSVFDLGIYVFKIGSHKNNNFHFLQYLNTKLCNISIYSWSFSSQHWALSCLQKNLVLDSFSVWMCAYVQPFVVLIQLKKNAEKQ